jgi:cytochrome oxidase Cu insertion factor (SCO1/SenC/PrrC family)
VNDSATFSRLQHEPGPEAKDVGMISVSIDPEMGYSGFFNEGPHQNDGITYRIY